MNARRAPERIGEGHGADELGDLRIDGRATGSTASRLPVPERAEAQSVPANHGLRLNDMERFAPPCPPLREPHPEDAVEETHPRSLGAAAEQGELLSQRQVLKNEVGAGLQRSAQSAQQSEYEGHCYAGSLDRRPTSSVRPIFWPTTGHRVSREGRTHPRRSRGSDQAALGTELRGVLRLAVPTSIAVREIIPRLPRFLEAYLKRARERQTRGTGARTRSPYCLRPRRRRRASRSRHERHLRQRSLEPWFRASRDHVRQASAFVEHPVRGSRSPTHPVRASLAAMPIAHPLRSL